MLEAHSAEDIREAETLLANAKIDVNDFFASGNGKAEFQELLSAACTPVEFGIQSLPEDAPEEERNRQLEPVLAEISAHSPLEQSRLLKLVQERLGKAVPMATLKEQVRSVQQNRRDNAKREKKAKRLNGSPPGSCRGRVDEVLIDTELENGAPDYTAAAEAAYDWFTANGAQFFHTQTGEPFMYFDNSILEQIYRGRANI